MKSNPESKESVIEDIKKKLDKLNSRTELEAALNEIEQGLVDFNEWFDQLQEDILDLNNKAPGLMVKAVEAVSGG